MELRPALLLPLVAVLASVAFSDRDLVTERAVGSALDAVVVDVARLAGLGPSASAERALPVAVVVPGDLPWLRARAKLAVARDPALSVADGPHQMRFSYVHDGTTWAVSGQLWRKGWSIRPPQPTIVRVVPWVVVLAAALGAALWLKRVPGAIAAAVAAAAAQLGLAWQPWPEAIARVPWLQAVRAGPGAAAVVRWAQALPEVSVALGAGLVAACVVLAIFDHRRTRGQGGFALASAPVVLAAALLWLEAASRAGVVSWALTPMGIVGSIGVVAFVIACGRERGRDPAPMPPGAQR